VNRLIGQAPRTRADACGASADRTGNVLGIFAPSHARAARANSLFLMGTSCILLLLTCVEFPIVQKLATILWLFSLLVLAGTNLGGALGVYIISVALHGSMGRATLAQLLDHPDNLALLLVLGFMALAILRRKHRELDVRLILGIGIFAAYGIANIVLLSKPTPTVFAEFFRTFLIPFGLFALAFKTSLNREELHHFFWAVLILGIYSSLVAVLQQLSLNALIFPRWIVDPAINQWLETGRAGGVLMHAGWNGLFLNFSLFVLLYGRRLGILQMSQVVQALFSVLLAAGVFFCYSRGVWLGTILLLVIFFWTPARQVVGARANVGLRRVVLVSVILVGLGAALMAPADRAAERTGNVSTIKYRLDLWRIGLNMVTAKPIIGHGYRGFEEQAADYHVTGFGQVSERALIYGQPSSHNTTLQIVVEFGLVGVMLYGMILLLMYTETASNADRLWGGRGKWAIRVLILVYLIKIQFGVATDQTTNTTLFLLLGTVGGCVVGARKVMRSEPWVASFERIGDRERGRG